MSANENPLWYKDAIIYQLHVKCFYDSNSDGIGDFHGLIRKLDYIVSLGVTAIWLLPFYPSPMKDDGYDISDYQTINPDFGRLTDFKHFLNEAHARKLKVITELVINHTSDQHRWFQLSRHAPRGSKWHSYYMWSDTPDRFSEARIIFKDFESSNWAWDPVKKAYYWHRFYSHQPDLNFDSPHVKREIFNILDFWFDMGVDGLRLDAIPYLYAREGTNCENLKETHEFLKELRAHVDKKYTGRMLLAEANQWPEDAISYFGTGDECHMAFHFPVMPRMFMALQMEDRFPIIDILDQTPVIPESCQWAMFLRNHDELTLEMVTDEERDYMYRMYAKDPKARLNLGIRRRLAPLLENNRAKFELIHILLFSLPGTPVIYYGDEIGMGDNYYLGDRNGVRTPMQWSGDRNGGFSKANPQQLYLPLIIDPHFHYQNINVENQEQNPSSNLWWIRNAITVRQRYRAFGNGTLKFLTPKNPKIIAFIRKLGSEVLLVIANLSKYSQYAELDLGEFAGYQPIDIFSQNKFPHIKEQTYGLSLGPWGYFWLSLEKEAEASAFQEEKTLPEISVAGHKGLLETLVHLPNFSKIMQSYLPRCHWFQGTEGIKRVKIKIDLPFFKWRLLLLEATLRNDQTALYFLPLSIMEKGAILQDHPEAAIALIKGKEREWLCLDALFDEGFQKELLRHFSHRKGSDLLFQKGKFFNTCVRNEGKSKIQNGGIVYDEQFYLKIYRKIEEGLNPEVEVLKFLSEEQKFGNVPLYAGAISIQDAKKHHFDIGLLQKFEPNEGDAFSQMQEIAKRFFEELQLKNIPAAPHVHFLQDVVSEKQIGIEAKEIAMIIGRCTAKMHEALASGDGAFAPEPFTVFDQRSVYETMRKQIKLAVLNQEALSSSEKEMLEIIKVFLKHRFALAKIRIHGDYELDKLMNTGKDFLVCDFRKSSMKKLVMSDLADMTLSFTEAAYTALHQSSTLRNEEVEAMKPWAEIWGQSMSCHFIEEYKATLGNSPLVPSSGEEFRALLKAYLLDRYLNKKKPFPWLHL